MFARTMKAWLDGAQGWYRASIANRIVVATFLLAMFAVLAIGLAAYLSLSRLMDQAIEARLNAAATLTAQRIDDRLERMLGDVMDLASGSLMSNAIIDSEGRGGYLSPMLREYRQAHAEVLEIGLYDVYGQPLAASGDRHHAHAQWAAKAVEEARTVLYLRSEQGIWSLHLIAPVRLPGTYTIEGTLVCEIDLAKFLRSASPVNASGIVTKILDASGQAIIPPPASPVRESMREQAVRTANGRLQEIGPIWVVASLSEATATLQATQLRWAFLVAVVLTALLSYWLGRALARRVTAPMTDLADQAMAIADGGLHGAHPLDSPGHDEVGRLGHAFNKMLGSLRQTHDGLEGRVVERTAQLTRRELYLRATLDNFPFLIWLKDADSRFLAVNAMMSEACGQASPDAMAGLTDSDVWPADLAERYRQDDAQVMTSKREKIVEEPIEESGQRWWYETYKKPVINEWGEVIGTVGFARDITERKESEQALMLRDRAIMSTTDGITIVDMTQPGQAVLFCNPALERITGYSGQEIRTLGLRTLHRGETEQPNLKTLRQAIAERRECRVVLRNYRKDGSLFWNDLTVAPVCDEAGIVISYIGILHDITESVQANAAMVASERRLSLSLDALRDGLWDWNMIDNSLYQSPSWAAMMGYSPEELTGRLDSYLRCLPEDQRDEVLGSLQSHLQGDTDSYSHEHRMRRKDGSEIWVSDRGRIVEWTEDGKPARMVGTITDVTERYQAEEAIGQLVQRLDLVLNLSAEAYLYIDSDERVALVNPACERFTGLSSTQLLGLSMPDFLGRLRQLADPTQPFPVFLSESVHSETDEPVRPKAFLFLRLPEPRVLSWEWRHNEGADHGVLYFRDVTRETEVDRMKSEFLSSAAHELRTPMASIMGFSELLLNREYDADTARDFLKTIQDQSRRLADLLNELLDLARIEARAGKDFNFKPQPLARVLKDCAAALSGQIKGSALRLETAEDLPLVMMDAAKIQQAVLNVLSNAFKYSPAAAEVSLRAYGENGDVCIVVEDHGIGMNPEQVARVFERFYRADPSGNIPGTGLGMSLSKEIIDIHGGGITVTSALNKGTTVTIRLPAAPELATIAD
jgi:PAS domain S-box-containing protein